MCVHLENRHSVQHRFTERQNVIITNFSSFGVIICALSWQNYFAYFNVILNIYFSVKLFYILCINLCNYLYKGIQMLNVFSYFFLVQIHIVNTTLTDLHIERNPNYVSTNKLCFRVISKLY